MARISTDDLESFSLQKDAAEEKRLLDILPIKKKRYKTALVVGRFQPLHRGHIHLLQAALRLASSVSICIGSANITDSDNPFSVDTRTALLRRVLEREYIMPFVQKIFVLDDTPDDDAWIAEAIKIAGDFDVVIGNNDWVNGLFAKAGYAVIEIPLLNRDIYEGKTIRKNLRQEGKL